MLEGAVSRGKVPLSPCRFSHPATGSDFRTTKGSVSLCIRWTVLVLCYSSETLRDHRYRFAVLLECLLILDTWNCLLLLEVHDQLHAADNAGRKKFPNHMELNPEVAIIQKLHFDEHAYSRITIQWSTYYPAYSFHRVTGFQEQTIQDML